MNELNLLVSRKLRAMWRGNVISLVSAAVILLAALVMLLTAKAGLSDEASASVLVLYLFVGLFTLLAALVGGLIYLEGLYGLKDVQPEYKRALHGIVLLVVLGIVNVFFEGLVSDLLGVVSNVLSLWILWLVLQATGRMLRELGRDDLAQRGRTVWLVYIASTVTGAVTAFFPALEEMSPVLAAVYILLTLVGLAGLLLYLAYLSRAANAFRSAGESGGQNVQTDFPGGGSE